MNPKTTSSNPSQAPARTSTSTSTVDQWLEKADDFARDEPVQAVAGAFGAGFLINLLPIGAIVGALAAVAFAMARPLLLFFGLLKVSELIRQRNNR